MRFFWQTCLALIAGACLMAAPAQAQRHGSHGTPPHPAGTTGRSAPHAPATFVQRIETHPVLVARLQPLLPAGMTLARAAQGFRNQGQFIAALHVAHNLDIPFTQLKAEMTGADHDSLGQAIHDLKPTADATLEARKATAEAREDLKTTRRSDDRDTDRDDR